MPAVPPSIIEPIWDQFSALLPAHEAPHPLGCHRRRIPDRVVFDRLVQVLVFGCANARIADTTCSVTILRRRRDAWIATWIMFSAVIIIVRRLICQAWTLYRWETYSHRKPCPDPYWLPTLLI